MPEDELYDATRGWWVLGPKREQAPYAVAVARGVVRAVYEVHSWRPRYYNDDAATLSPKVRWGFDGAISDEHGFLVGTDVRHLFPAGAANPVTYVNLDETSRPATPPPAPSTDRMVMVREQVERLQENPVLVLSLHSKELFHSNLLGWLVERFPSAGASVLRPWLVPDLSRDVLRVRREKYHLDLIVELPGYKHLVIENKVFSLPDPAQLLGYSDKNIPSAGAADGTRVLLSLLDPGWPERQWKGWTWAPWHDVTLRMLQEPEVVEGDAFVSTLVKSWAELIASLTNIATLVAPTSDTETFLLDGDVLELLEQVRLDDAMQKFRTFAMRLRVEEALNAADIVVDEVESGFRNATPLLSVKVATADEGQIGWQLQGGQWRRFVIVPPKHGGRGDLAREKRSAYVQSQHAAWLNFHTEQEIGPFAPAPDAAFKHFAPDFAYNYVRVPELTVATLLELAVGVARDAVTYAGR
jgi:hypothetical protein